MNLRSASLLLGSWLFALPATATTMLQGRVESILGGDNILVNINGELKNIDLANITVPISETPNWEQLATQRLGELLPPGTPVLLDVAWQVDGQIYAHVYGPDGMVNVRMVREGISVPRVFNSSDIAQQWISQAGLEAQANKVGYFQYQGTVSSSDLQPALLPRVGYWGLGGVAVVASMLAARHVWRKWYHQPLRVKRRQKQELQQELTQAVTQQKTLERQYGKALTQVQESLSLAEMALRNGNEDQARGALVRKKQHQTEANTLLQRLQETEIHVTTLRTTLTSLDMRIQSPVPGSED